MPNRLYNKQVTPKGYKRGGGVTDKKPNKSNFKSILKKASILTPGGAGLALGKKISDRVKKMGGGMMKRSMYKRGGGVDVEKAKEFRKNRKKPIRTFIKNTLEGKYMGDGNRGTAEPKRIVGNRRVKRKMGGALKPVDPKTQKGLSKLPTEVRNKMGYMKKGGKVHGK